MSHNPGQHLNLDNMIKLIFDDSQSGIVLLIIIILIISIDYYHKIEQIKYNTLNLLGITKTSKYKNSLIFN